MYQRKDNRLIFSIELLNSMEKGSMMGLLLISMWSWPCFLKFETCSQTSSLELFPWQWTVILPAAFGGGYSLSTVYEEWKTGKGFKSLQPTDWKLFYCGCFKSNNLIFGIHLQWGWWHRLNYLSGFLPLLMCFVVVVSRGELKMLLCFIVESFEGSFSLCTNC